MKRDLGRWLDGIVMALRLRPHGVANVAKHLRVFSSTSPAERFALFQMAKRLPQGARALEMGSHLGSSALFICAGLAHCNGHLVCVDTWMNHTMPDANRDTYAEFTCNIRPYAHMITAVRKFSQELTEADIGGSLDFVFIDGDHSEDAVRKDFQIIAPSVKIGGMVAFHDVIPEFPGVQVVVGEAMASGAWHLVRMVNSLGTLRKVKDHTDDGAPRDKILQ